MSIGSIVLGVVVQPLLMHTRSVPSFMERCFVRDVYASGQKLKRYRYGDFALSWNRNPYGVVDSENGKTHLITL